MTLRLSLVKSTALIGAVALHVVLLQPWDPPETPMTEAGAGAVSARLGTSFADMVAGIQQPLSSQEVIRPDSPVQRSNRPEVQPTVAADPTVEPPSNPYRSLTKTPARDTLRAQTAKGGVAARAPSQVTAGLDTSLRPRARPENHRAAQVSKPQDPPRATAAPEKKAGEGPQDAVQGTAVGQVAARAKTQGRSTAREQTSGNAEATNYPGVVMRYIARQRRPDLSARGTAVIAFTIAADGGLAAAEVARSSGSSTLDNAALRIVQRAAPFPPPPAGARRSHSIGIKGRS
ncbi:energy transducer TonB [uncultured Roseobacter sp.]|uniref:energy transducer TonB n=1 Tax=uncultured Roseobacter sp. TaxID=114847 RepID=UPI00261976B3|nr:TonB family protein [uncultured Roseobacter sp.]